MRVNLQRRLAVLIMVALLISLLPVSAAAAPDPECGRITVPLLVGGEVRYGEVEAEMTPGGLLVTYTLDDDIIDDDWVMTQLRLHVTDSVSAFPTVPPEPLIEDFAHKADDLQATTYTFTVDVSGLSPTDGLLYLAAYAQLQQIFGEWELCQEDILINGGFETPVVDHSAKWDIFPSGTTGLGWSVAWHGGETSYNDVDRPETANLELHRGVSGWASHQGDQHAELDSDWDGPGGTLTGEPASVTIWQDLTTVVGNKYELSYAFSPRPNTGAGDNVLVVGWNGLTVDTHTSAGGGNTNWAAYTRDFIAEGTSTELRFTDGGTPNSQGTLLDSVAVAEYCWETRFGKPLQGWGQGEYFGGESDGMYFALQLCPVPGQITVLKLDHLGRRLDGGEFTLYAIGDDQLQPVGSPIGTSNGIGAFANVPPGAYLVRETAAPEGYTSGGERNVTIELTYLGQGASKTVTFVNRPDLGSITVHKYDETYDTRQWCIVSDTQTTAYGESAVESWVHSEWQKTSHTDIKVLTDAGAKWIWATDRPVEPVDGEIIEMQRGFEISGVPLSGQLQITTDNGYEVRLNGMLLGSAQVHGSWRTSDLTESFVNSSGWQSVETYDVSALLVSGSNLLEISAANEQMNGGTVDSNPAGVLFRLCVTEGFGETLEATFGLEQDGEPYGDPKTGSTVTWTGLPAGEYTVIETVPPQGYDGQDPVDVQLGAGQHVVLGFVNTPSEQEPDPSIMIQKYVSVDGPDGPWHDADEAPGPNLYKGTRPHFRYVVTNTGNVTFAMVEVYDDVFGPIGTVPSLLPGADASWEMDANWTEGQHANTASVYAFCNEPPVPNGQSVQLEPCARDSDLAHYLGIDREPPPAPSGTITVNVVKTDSGNVSGLPVTVTGGVNASLTTNASGQVQLTGLSAGTYTVDSSDAGYTGDGPKDIVLVSDSGSGSATITLTPVVEPPPVEENGAIEGIVTEEGTGDILPGATVQVFDSEGNPYSAPLLSDSAGYYSVTDVPPGNYTVSATLDGYSGDIISPVTVLAGETTEANPVLAKTIVIEEPPDEPAAPPDLPKTGGAHGVTTLLGLALAGLGLAVPRRRRRR